MPMSASASPISASASSISATASPISASLPTSSPTSLSSPTSSPSLENGGNADGNLYFVREVHVERWKHLNHYITINIYIE